MERIMIIGCGCSGKSTLARRLGECTGIPVVHLDQIWWSPGDWKHLERDAFDRLLLEQIEKPAWIMDGNYDRTMPLRLERADTVIYLDYNRIVCIISWIKRVLTNWGKARDDMAKGCNEWFDPEFFTWMWQFNRMYRKHYHRMLLECTDKTAYIFKNRQQLKKFLDGLGTTCNPEDAVVS